VQITWILSLAALTGPVGLEPAGEGTAPLVGRIVEGRTLVPSDCGVEPVGFVEGADHVQAYSRSSRTWRCVERDFLVGDRLRDPSTGLWSDQVVCAYPAPFEILDADSARAGRFVVIGRAESGDTIVEVWARRGASSVPSAGSPVPEIERRVVYRGGDLKSIRRIAIDPRERFLWAIHGEERALLSSLTLVSGRVWTWFDERRIPGLGEVRSMPAGKGADGERVWVLLGKFGPPYTLLWDENDDGVVEDVTRAWDCAEFFRRERM